MKLVIVFASFFLLIKLAASSQSLTQASAKNSNQSHNQKIQDVMNSYSEASTISTPFKDGNKATDRNNTHHHSKLFRKHKKKQSSLREKVPEERMQGRGIYQSLDKDTSKTGIEGRGLLHLMKSKKTKVFDDLVTSKSADLKGRGLKNNRKPPITRVTGQVTTTPTTTVPPLPDRTMPPQPDRLPDDVDCSEVNKNSNWEDQIKIRPCHFTTHDHPRQQPRKIRSSNVAYDEQDRKNFKHLAIFNIKHDLDFQEAGEPCSVGLQNEFMLSDSEDGIGPVDIDLMSFNRLWYKRLCSFFSYLECVPNDELRKKRKHSPGGSKHVENDDEHEMIFKDSGLDTTGLLRLKIGGRGPGKARHKSGPGGGRLDHRAFQGMSDMVEDDWYDRDGTCVCSYVDPKYPYPYRNRTFYGMNFVEDEARPRWCVAAPGNLCGRVYFKRHTWPGQVYYEFSDHIGCPRKYNGDEYECVRWKKDPNVKTNRTEFPNAMTSTCEKKPKDPEIERQRKDKKITSGYRRRSASSVQKGDTISVLLLIAILVAV